MLAITKASETTTKSKGFRKKKYFNKENRDWTPNAMNPTGKSSENITKLAIDQNPFI